MGPVARRLSIATRVSLLVVIVAIVSLAVTALVVLERGGSLARDAVAERLDATAAGRAAEVARHVRGLQESIAALAASPATDGAVVGFTEAHEELGSAPPSREAEDRLADHYLAEVVPPLEEVRGEPVPLSGLLPVTAAAVTLQAGWTVGDDEITPVTVDDNGDGSSWTAIHTELHPAYRRIAEQSGFSDLAFVSAAGDVVYTARKGIDLGTNLDVGPQSGSGLAIAVREVSAAPQQGLVVVTDLVRTQAVGDRPVGVVASPVFDGDRFVGVVAGQFDAEPLTGIMSAGGGWTGLGSTGQAYIAADDGTMRSDARGLLGDPRAYLAAAEEQLTPDQARAIEALDTTVVFQPVDADVVGVASTGPGRGPTLSPTGTDVVASWRPVDVEGVTWTAVAELSQAEIDAPVARFGRIVLVVVALVVLLVTFVAVPWANRLVAPLRQVSDRIRRARTMDVHAPAEPETPLPPRTPREYRELSEHIDEMLVRLRARGREVLRRQAERIMLLRQFLPPTMADRAAAGEQDVLERVERASVAAVEIRGLGAFLRDDARGDARDLLGGLVDDLDEAAREHGLERFRLSGNAYAAVCGTSRPHLDHAPRCLAFARAARELVTITGLDADAPLVVGVGVASGPVTVGLTGGDRLVHDCWGETVDRAGDLARAASTGELLVDDAARALLPQDVRTVTPSGRRPHGAERVVDEPVVPGAPA